MATISNRNERETIRRALDFAARSLKPLGPELADDVRAFLRREKMSGYLLINTETGELASHDCLGQHDGKFCRDVDSAKAFDSFGEASDYSQNFGSDWTVMDSGDAVLLLADGGNLK